MVSLERNNETLKKIEGLNKFRGMFYNFLSRAFEDEVDEKFLETISSFQPIVGSIASVLQSEKTEEGAKLLRDFVKEIEMLKSKKREEYLLKLASEFAILFLGLYESRSVPVYESVYLSEARLVMQKPRHKVLEEYGKVGLEKVKGFPEPEDHIALEMNFMSKLSGKLSKAIKEQNFDSCLSLLDYQEKFLEEHLISWVPIFCKDLRERASTKFYRSLSLLAENFILLDRQLINSLAKKFEKKDSKEVSLFTLEEFLAKTALPIIKKRTLFKEIKPVEKIIPVEEVIPTGCTLDCGGRCLMKAHIKDGTIVRFEPGEPDEGERYEIRPCFKGLTYNHVVYSPYRLKYPLKRTGKRGEGKFKRISWEEALGTIANEIVRIKGKYGPASILNDSSGGGHGLLHNRFSSYRLLNMFGGQTWRWGIPSVEHSVFASFITYNDVLNANSREDLLNSRLIILWGFNPAEVNNVSNTAWIIIQAKEAGAKIVIVDPRLSPTGMIADKWIPIMPGTDAAMLVSMAYVMITENLYDEDFINTYTLGFEKFKNYVLGKEDGTPKTPDWAEAITKVPASTIRDLAREYATIKPAALIPSWGPGRGAFGEQYHRAASTLAAMTGNIGISGGGAAGANLGAGYGLLGLFYLPEGENPVDLGAPLRKTSIPQTPYKFPWFNDYTTKVHFSKLWEAILDGTKGGYHSDIRMMYITNGNALNQLPNANKGVRALKALEFVVVHEQFLNPTAKFADILLPVATWCERNEITDAWAVGSYCIYNNKIIEPMYEVRTDLEIFTELAEKLGISGFSGKTEDEWLRELSKDSIVPDYDAFKKRGFYRQKKNYIAYKEQIEDPVHNLFPTPSGKIEIYSERLEKMNELALPPIPKYMEPHESYRNVEIAKKYPLQIINAHYGRRTHSQFQAPFVREVEPHALWINSLDAKDRGIKQGEEVRVFNDRGEVRIKAKVTGRIIPGVVFMYEGAWYTPDDKGIDRGGCTNTLTNSEHSPGGALCSNTVLVQVDKVNRED